jgi:hypothetical protein
MNAELAAHQLILESRIARLRGTIAEITNRLTVAHGVAAEEALADRLQVAEQELQRAQSALDAMPAGPTLITPRNSTLRRARQAETETAFRELRDAEVRERGAKIEALRKLRLGHD